MLPGGIPVRYKVLVSAVGTSASLRWLRGSLWNNYRCVRFRWNLLWVRRVGDGRDIVPAGLEQTAVNRCISFHNKVEYRIDAYTIYSAGIEQMNGSGTQTFGYWHALRDVLS